MESLRTLLLVLSPLLFTISPPQTPGQSTTKEATNEWAKADTAITNHLKQIDPNMRSAVFASALLRKYLPDFKVHVRFDRHLAGETRIFLVNRRGEITPLPNEEWRKNDAEKFSRSSQVAEFLRRQKIRVESAEEAVEAAKLFEEVQGAAFYVAFLNINTRDFTVFDKAFIESQFGPRINWKYSAEKRKKGWLVKEEYVGPPASVMNPPVYEIDLDEQQMFQDLRRF